jgi:hypothetical protein
MEKSAEYRFIRMCIVPFPVNSIESTKIFVLPSEDKKRQMTFYKNDVDSIEENMMILPFPNPKSLQLHKIRYKAMFDDLESSVWKISTRSYEMVYAMAPMSRCASLEYIPVISHGSYLISIAEKLEDLSRINPTVFDLPEGIFDFFRNHYNSQFGYLVCKLKEGKSKYEPLCYSHQALPDKLFVPTLHYHNHNGKVDTDKADWDHLIYSLGTGEEANMKYKSYKSNKVDWRKFPEGYQHSVHSLIRCAAIEGNYPNKDLAFQLVV